MFHSVGGQKGRAAPIPPRTSEGQPSATTSLESLSPPKPPCPIELPSLPGGLEPRRILDAMQARVSHRQLLSDIKRTIPHGIEVYRPFHYVFPLIAGTLDLIVLKAFVPPHKEQALKSWEKDFEERHGVSLVIQRSSVYSGAKEELRDLAEGRRLLTAQHAEDIKALIERALGKEPGLPDSSEALLEEIGKLPDHTEVPFVAIDPHSVRDREDVIHAERVGEHGDIRVRVGFIDVTPLVAPDSPLDRFARRLGRTIYGSHDQIPTLGKDLAFSLASFVEGEERAAIIVDQVFDVSGRRKSGKVYRGRIRNHESVSPRALEACSLDGCSQVMRALKEATGRLRRRRCNSETIFRIDRDDPGADIVGECMIAAKSELARFLLREKVPAIFRVHTPPTRERMETLAYAVRNIGIAFSPSDFEHPARLAALLTVLEDMNAYSLIQEVVDVFLGRTRFDHVNHGHRGIGVPAYLEIKPRESTGLQNQFQVRAALERESYQGLSPEDIETRVHERNKLREAEDSREFKFRFFERLMEGLRHEKRVFPGIIREVRGSECLVEFEEFSRWGVVPISRDIERRVFPGKRVMARLEGFNVERMRFEFSPYFGRP